ARSALDLARDYTRRNLEKLAPFGSFESNHLSIVREDGAYDIYNGGLRAREAQGELIFDHVDNQEYHQYIAEEVRSWSYMKFPFIRSLGPEKGWYRVGPLARVNNCDYFDTPEAEAARKEFKALTDDRPNNVTMAYHWARMIELLHSVEKIGELLHDSDLQGTDLQTRGARRNEAVGIIEAPRGTLFHHFVVDDNDLVVKANLIVSTTSNNEPMNRAVQRVAEDHLSGVPEISDGLLNHVEVAIRAYDPCLSCATHALGRMPLIVELVSAEGETVAQRVKG
ncbi:MAG: nickel-dependent hydrogenase large subunit, partial [Acidobacteriota bacterium]